MSSASPLPDILPIFPLAGVILLPRAKLPLNIFEPRYLIMIEEALATRGRMIGMVQPNIPAYLSEGGVEQESPPVYAIGCAGRISSFNETDDGRLMIALTGLSRFTIGHELALDKPYRRVAPDWSRFAGDLAPAAPAVIDRARLLIVLKSYFRQHQIEADWEAVDATNDEPLISSLVMICPFAPNERQALLEAPDLTARAELMIALLEMAVLEPSNDNEGGVRH